jgi:hypothetical protein
MLSGYDPLTALLSVESRNRSCIFHPAFLSRRFLLRVFAKNRPKPTIYFLSNVPYNGRLAARRLKQLDQQISGFRIGN